jgi:hypothetical protein
LQLWIKDCLKHLSRLTMKLNMKSLKSYNPQKQQP